MSGSVCCEFFEVRFRFARTVELLDSGRKSKTRRIVIESVDKKNRECQRSIETHRNFFQFPLFAAYPRVNVFALQLPLDTPVDRAIISPMTQLAMLPGLWCLL